MSKKMRIGDSLYFAPGLSFSALNLDNADLGDAWNRRIRGYYLQPASDLIDKKHAFASGLLILSAVDAISRYKVALSHTGDKGVGDRFKSFVQSELPSFYLKEDANALYCNYRNGIVHEARLKDGVEFDLEQNVTLLRRETIRSVNPAKLLEEVEQALVKFVAALAESEKSKQFAELLRKDFSFELEA